MIGYYIHHHGAGHITRATQIARHLRTPVTGFSTLSRPETWPGDWVRLAGDETDAPLDPTAGGVLHWAPLHHGGHGQRMATLSSHMAGLDALVVDVSVEVSLLARLHGVATIVLAMRGDRRDAPHRLGYESATSLLVPWGRQFPETWWPQHWTDKARFVGAISRFDDHPVGAPRTPGTPRRVLVLLGAGGHDLPEGALSCAKEATPAWQWTLRCPQSPSPDLWEELLGADVVVCHGGNNAVAEVAAARRPAVVVAQRRPFDEQHHTVEALERARICVGLRGWPEARDWPGILDAALERGGSGWSSWNRLDGAATAARYLDALVAQKEAA